MAAAVSADALQPIAGDRRRKAGIIWVTSLAGRRKEEVGRTLRSAAQHRGLGALDQLQAGRVAGELHYEELLCRRCWLPFGAQPLLVTLKQGSAEHLRQQRRDGQ